MTNLLKRFLPLLMLGAWLFTGCSSDSDEPKLSAEKEMLAFRLETSLNPGVLTADAEGVIDNTDIRITLPEGADCSSLVASFTYRGQGVYVDGKLQQSGVTANDFSAAPVVYRVVAEDKSTRQYTVRIDFKKGEEEAVLMQSFGFTKALNPGLTADCNLSVSGNRIYGGVTSSSRRLVATFSTDAVKVTVGGVEQVSGVTENDFTAPVTYVLTSASGAQTETTVTVTWQSAIPHIYIDTEGNRPIVEKDLYLTATLRIDGKGLYDSFEGTTQIKGRGNSTWGMPKKPYRLKLGEKTSLLGLGKAKNWVLLANYIDPSLMLNAVAMKTGQLLGLPFTNHIIPVDVTLNGRYIGNYMFTEKIEIGKSRVNIDDTNGGVLLELDTNYDEDWKFHSTHYQLPVMVKDPDVETQAQFETIRSDFQRLEDLVAAPGFPANNYLDYIDAESVALYLIVYNFTHNMEINHPKSTYLYKENGTKYKMGPIWDFDWAFDYEGHSTHFTSYTNPLFGNIGNGAGRNFFTRLLEDPAIKKIYKEKWTEFRTQHLGELLEYVDAYAASIKESQQQDRLLWPGVSNYPQHIEKLKNWLQGRAGYMDNYVRNF